MPTVANNQNVPLTLSKDDTNFCSITAIMATALARTSGYPNAKYTLASKSNLHS